MPPDKKYRYRLEVNWAGDWRKLWSSDKRLELDQYVASCRDPTLRFRVVDTLYEEVNEHGRRYKPR